MSGSPWSSPVGPWSHGTVMVSSHPKAPSLSQLLVASHSARRQTATCPPLACRCHSLRQAVVRRHRCAIQPAPSPASWTGAEMAPIRPEIIDTHTLRAIEMTHYQHPQESLGSPQITTVSPKYLVLQLVSSRDRVYCPQQYGHEVGLGKDGFRAHRQPRGTTRP
jgi:hypothetical protein